MDSCGGEGELERGALGARGGDAEASAVQGHDSPADGQPQATAALRGQAFLPEPAEVLEDRLPTFPRDAHPVVAQAHHRGAVLARLHAQLHRGAGRVAAGIGDEIGEEHSQELGIAQDADAGQSVGFQGHGGGVLRARVLHDALDQRLQGHLLAPGLPTPLLQPVVGEDVLDQSAQRIRLGDDARGVVARARGASHPALQRLGHHADGGQRRAQLVRHGGDEFRAQRHESNLPLMRQHREPDQGQGERSTASQQECLEAVAGLQRRGGGGQAGRVQEDGQERHRRGRVRLGDRQSIFLFQQSPLPHLLPDLLDEPGGAHPHAASPLMPRGRDIPAICPELRLLQREHEGHAFPGPGLRTRLEVGEGHVGQLGQPGDAPAEEREVGALECLLALQERSLDAFDPGAAQPLEPVPEQGLHQRGLGPPLGLESLQEPERPCCLLHHGQHEARAVGQPLPEGALDGGTPTGSLGLEEMSHQQQPLRPRAARLLLGGQRQGPLCLQGGMEGLGGHPVILSGRSGPRQTLLARAEQQHFRVRQERVHLGQLDADAGLLQRPPQRVRQGLPCVLLERPPLGLQRALSSLTLAQEDAMQEEQARGEHREPKTDGRERGKEVSAHRLAHHRDVIEIHGGHGGFLLELVQAPIEGPGLLDELAQLAHLLARADVLGELLPQAHQVVVGEVAHPVRAPQLLREQRHHRRELRGPGGVFQAVADHRGGQGLLHLPRLARFQPGGRILVPDAQRGEGGGAMRLALAELHLVEGGDRVSRADVARIHPVIGEVLLVQQAVLEADEPVAGNPGGIELHLHLHVPGDELEGARELLDEDAPRLGQCVHVGVLPIPDMGQPLHQLVVVVAHPKAHRGEPDALLGVRFHGLEDAVRLGDAVVGHAVRAKDDAAGGALAHLARCDGIGHLQPRLHVGGALGVEGVDGLQDARAVHDAGGFEHRAGRVAVHDDGQGVARVELLHQHRQGAFHQLEAVLHVHGPRHVDGEDEVGGKALGGAHLLALEAHVQHVVSLAVGRRKGLHLHPERLCSRVLVVVAEGVDELLHTDGLFRGKVVAREVCARQGIGGAVHVHGEGGDVLLLRVDGGVHPVVLEIHVRERLAVHDRHARELRGLLLLGGRPRRRSGFRGIRAANDDHLLERVVVRVGARLRLGPGRRSERTARSEGQQQDGRERGPRELLDRQRHGFSVQPA
ncbi:hypothetical protein STIAU_0428 [Stigmatella aurantiaca DW4/3-1]|uniref:Uncharacterized protein n=1 Tax=Stigmatella aurantiaca (strain DW4/3-1) TaxID=378806 RepID=Q08W95_STIAD|nr:hypothetical protein STIAU_0428 [Stigmatella aurantiaca DW4/3-1]